MGEDRCHPVSVYPGLSNMFWPPPSWLSPHSRSSWAFEDDDETQEDSSSREGVSSGDLISFRQWSELPKELLTTIADHLDSELDFCRFRAVCKRWHSSCPFLGSLLCSQLPYRTHGHCSLIFSPTESHRSTFLVARFIYLVRPLSQTIADSSTPWMISVEDLNPGKLRICHPLSKTVFRRFPWNFPKPLNLSDFQVSKLDVGSKLCFSNGDDKIFGDYPYSCPWSDYPASSKVILIGEEATSMHDCTLVVLFLHRGGYLACQSLRTSHWNHINSDKEHFRFDDIVSFKGRICAVDREGRTYLIDGYKMKVVSIITEELSYDFLRKQARKLLVESLGKLYMIVREGSEFKVYQLNEGQRKWKKVNSLGDRILFVSYDSCFFVEAKDIPGCRGNCIVFPKNCFPLYSGGFSPDYEFFDGESNHLAVGVFFLDENCSKKLSSYPGLSDLFWPPPSWLCPDSRPSPCDEDEQMSSSSESDSSWEEEEEEEMTAEDAAFQDMDHLPPASDVPLEIHESGVPTENFKGVSVRSDFVPILRKVWKRHGNIIEEHAVRSDDHLTWGLESLAKMILIIRNNRGKLLLDESQAKYLDSTFFDLQSMHFRLDWMVPIVERVLARHKKDPADVLSELQTQRYKLLEKLHEVEEKLVEQNMLMNETK